MDPVEIEDLPALAGNHVAVSGWRTIDQELVNRFADLTDDHYWLHVDTARAGREIGGTIVHGYLLLALLPAMIRGLLNIHGVARGFNYGAERLRFPAMLKVGKRVRVHQQLIGAERRGEGMLVRRLCTVEIEGEEKPAMVCEFLSAVYPR